MKKLINITSEHEFMCDCGHIETETNIHSVATHDDKGVIDLCEKCWCEADLREDNNSSLSIWRFNDKESKRRYLSHFNH